MLILGRLMNESGHSLASLALSYQLTYTAILSFCYTRVSTDLGKSISLTFPVSIRCGHPVHQPCMLHAS